MKTTDDIQKDREGGSELASEHQGEASECDLVPEEDHKTPEAHPHPRGDNERDKEDRAHSSLAPQVEVFTHLGHHDKVQVQMAAIVAILATVFFAPAL